MQQTYTLIYEEYEKAIIATSHFSPDYRPIKLSFSLVFSLILALIIPGTLGVKIILASILFGVGYWFTMDSWIKKLLQFTLARKNKKSFPLEITFMIEDTSFHYQSKFHEQIIPWSSVTHGLETEKYYLFYIASVNSLYGVKKDSTYSAFNQMIAERLRAHSVPLYSKFEKTEDTK